MFSQSIYNKTLFGEIDAPTLYGIEGLYDGIFSKYLKLPQMSELLKKESNLDIKADGLHRRALRNIFLALRVLS